MNEELIALLCDKATEQDNERNKAMARLLRMAAAALSTPSHSERAVPEYLNGGTRYKVCGQDKGSALLHLPARMAGQWVALVDATDDKHLAAAPSAPAATGWLPIETAPKDGKMFLVLLPQQGRLIVRARYDTIHGHWLTDYEGEGGITRPYFFHPGDLWHLLPPAPSVDGEG